MRFRIPFVFFAASSLAAADQAHLAASPFEGSRQPRLHASTLSLYGTAADYERTLDLRLALEWPLSDRNSVVGGLRRRTFTPASPEQGGGFDLDGWGFEAALRRHPWEWMPGFFMQGLLAFERSRAGNLQYDPVPSAWHRIHNAYSEMDETVHHRDRTVVETGVGYGYVWTLGRLSVELQGIFGPRIWAEEIESRWLGEDGSARRESLRYGDWSGFLRFRDLRIGYRL